MKKIILTLLAATAVLTSCKKSSSSDAISQAIVTVKGEQGGECLMQLDDKTVLVPDIATFPYKHEVRALILYKDRGETERNDKDYTYRKAEMVRIDTILTKKPVPSLGSEENDRVYGTAPTGIYNSWMTVVEDGYITLHFVGLWGSYPMIKHTVNLVRDTDTSDPLLFEFRHNYNEDVKAPYGYYRDGIVAFDINEILNKLNTNTFNITVRHIGLPGDIKDVKFQYTRGTSAHITSLNEEGEFTLTQNFD